MVTHLLAVLAPLIATPRNTQIHGSGITGSLTHLPYALTLACIVCEAALGAAILAVGLIRLHREHQQVHEHQPTPSLG